MSEVGHFSEVADLTRDVLCLAEDRKSLVGAVRTAFDPTETSSLILPHLSRLSILWNPDFARNQSRLTSMREAINALQLTLVPAEARGPDALEQAFATMIGQRAQVLVVLSDGVLFNNRGQIGAMAIRDRLPTISAVREYAEAGLLLTYGPDLADLFRRSAVFVDKIFKGAKPADLPVEQPIKFELVINLRTAKALGLIVPPSLLARADEVIE